jgi:hypothetical protein
MRVSKSPAPAVENLCPAPDCHAEGMSNSPCAAIQVVAAVLWGAPEGRRNCPARESTKGTEET